MSKGPENTWEEHPGRGAALPSRSVAGWGGVGWDGVEGGARGCSCEGGRGSWRGWRADSHEDHRDHSGRCEDLGLLLLAVQCRVNPEGFFCGGGGPAQGHMPPLSEDTELIAPHILLHCWRFPGPFDQRG